MLTPDTIQGIVRHADDLTIAHYQDICIKWGLSSWGSWWVIVCAVTLPLELCIFMNTETADSEYCELYMFMWAAYISYET